MSTNHHPIRAHLRSLIPSHRRAFFRARVIVHELINIPLVSGEFALKWRFQRAQPVHPDYLSAALKDKIKDNEQLSSVGTIEDNSSEQDSLAESTKASSGSSGASSPLEKHPAKSFHSDIPSYSQYLAPEVASSVTNNPSEDILEVPDTCTTAPRGVTKFCPLLLDHTVEYNHRIDVNLDITVDKESSDLHPSEFKLTVLQEAEERDSDSSSSFGGVVINLSEYVNAGIVTRHHLLCGSKTNAVLRITIQMRHIGGESQFVVPPLLDTPIMSGVSGLLARDGLRQSALNAEAFRSHNTPASRGSPVPTPNRPAFLPRNSILQLPSQAPSPVASASTEYIIDTLFNPNTSPSPPNTAPPLTISYKPHLSSDHKVVASEINSTPIPTAARGSMDSDHSTTVASMNSVGSEATKSRVHLFKKPFPHRNDSSSSSSGKWWRIGGGNSSRSSSPVPLSAPPLQTRMEIPSPGGMLLVSPQEGRSRGVEGRKTPMFARPSTPFSTNRSGNRAPTIAITDTDSLGKSVT